jgi:hypothetical protein
MCSEAARLKIWRSAADIDSRAAVSPLPRSSRTESGTEDQNKRVDSDRFLHWARRLSWLLVACPAFVAFEILCFKFSH